MFIVRTITKEDEVCIVRGSSVMAYTTTAAREHVEELRRTKFSIGGKPIPALRDLQQALKYLSAELYAKDIHFLMELIQVFVHITISRLLHIDMLFSLQILCFKTNVFDFNLLHLVDQSLLFGFVS